MSKELEKIKVKNNNKEIFPEHEFLGSCLRIGLHIADLEKITYIDVMKIFVTYLDRETSTRKATQSDIDKLLG